MSSFYRSGRLVCPKCSKYLTHIGLDYDKPGHVQVCRECGNSDSAALVGFVCIDCGTNKAADEITSRDWYGYELTTPGEQVLIDGDFAAFSRRKLTAYDPVRPVLLQMLREAEEFGDPLTVLSIDFTRKDAVANGRTSRQARAICLETLQGGLRPVDVVTEYGNGFLLALPRIKADTARAQANVLIKRIKDVLRNDPGLTISFLSADGVRAIAEGRQ
jgi:ribosomal protein L32